MSGIYIPSMEMPKNCEECAIKTWDTEDYVCPFSGVSTLCISRQSDCPLIAVPDHGRLIDADALKKEWRNGFHRKIVDALMEDAPTIIPADKDGAE